MASTIWYWEYQLKVWDEYNYEEGEEVVHCGVVAADSMTEAMQQIENYYGNDIIELQMLRPIVEGIFDFEEVTKETDFDFEINKRI